MNFLHPEFLYYMIVPLLILFGLLLTQKAKETSFFSAEVMDKLRVGSNSLSMKGRNYLFLLMGILIVIALAGPVIDDGKVEVKAKSADIMIALDISDSMLASDVYPNRLKLAKQKALELLKLAPNERIGVIGFAKNSYLVSPLSFDHKAVSFLLRQLNTSSITEKGTNFLSMLEVVDRSMKKESKKYLLILSDGGDSEDFSHEIAYAKEHKIAIFVLGVGTTKGAPIKQENGEFIKQNGNIIVSKLNENIADLATKSGGVYIESVNSNDDVKAMLEEIDAHSEKRELKSEEIARYIPLFYYPLALALLILLIATSSFSKREIKNVSAMFMAVMFLTNSVELNAGVLDFVQLDEAKEAYGNEEYTKSAEIYESYSKETDSAQSSYNLGNSLYKQGKFKEARESYEKAAFEDAALNAKKLSNIGNSYVKEEATKENLQKAVEAYENSLKLQEDKQTRENLEAVKKAIKEQEKKEEENKENEDKDKQDKDKKDDKQDKKDDESKKDENSDEKNEDSQDKDSKEKEDKKSQEQKDKEQQEKEEQEKKEQEKSQKEKEEDKAEELKDENSTQQQPQQVDMSDEMSDEEQNKWLKQLNKQQNTYMYMLNQENKVEENEDAKPW
ncbi:VWA domain-containing protein [Sulfurimonas aquatica]|uniref:VWA domain-containing protein n=1 Tax=Sulfurimonas aquatica TaxID=2672570 RepID=A0A975GC92_9BACT|nr:VWA domain-containing protein [Sulfurimonas aquatica]QSZ41272.1 VWA domain-containing protein [Sulfurimonas aquatica]